LLGLFADTIYTLKLPFRWIYRKIFRRKGFGVQSPFAFLLVKNAIEEEQEYYAYQEITQEYEKKECSLTLKEIKLLYRLCLYHKAPLLFFAGKIEEIEKISIQQALEGYLLFTRKNITGNISCTLKSFIYISLRKEGESLLTLYEDITPHINERTMLVIYGIHLSYSFHRDWEKYVRIKGQMSIDLFHFGIVFYSPHLSNVHYNIID